MKGIILQRDHLMRERMLEATLTCKNPLRVRDTYQIKAKPCADRLQMFMK